MTKQSAYAAAGRCLAAMVPWLICGLAALFYSYEYLLRVMPSVMEPELRTTYQLDASGFGALAAIYYIAYTPMQLFVGILMDRFGPRRLLAVSCLFCAIGTYLFAATEILSIAQTGRFLIGFGSAFAFVGVLKLASIWLPANRFALISGLTTTLGMAGAMFGDIVLTGIVHQIGWQELSVIAALVGVILAAVIFIFVRDRKATNQDKAQLQHTVSTYELTQGLLQLLKKPQMWFAGIIGCFLYLSAAAFAELWAIPYLENGVGLTGQQAGHATSLVFLGWIIGSPIMGFLSDTIQKRRPLLMLGSLFTAMLMAILLYYAHSLSLEVISLLLFSIGFFSSVQVIVFAIACELSNRKLTATAVSLINMFVMFSGLIFQPLIGHLLDSHWHGDISFDGQRIYTLVNYQFSLCVLPAAYLLVFVCAKWLLRESYQQDPLVDTTSH
jgi:MFS family permease